MAVAKPSRNCASTRILLRLNLEGGGLPSLFREVRLLAIRLFQFREQIFFQMPAR
jgi:hypothetical protein